jgi:hypothetical protein
MKYRGILDDPLLVRRALMAFFGPRELTRHLERFRQHVQVEAAQASVLAIP